MRKFVQIALGTLVVAALSAPTAFANTITPTPTPTIGPLVAGSYLWTYNVQLTGNSTVETGDFFTIFDFAGFVVGSQNTPAGWAATSQNSGFCPINAPGPAVCATFDDPTIPNLTWQRTGANVGPGPLSLGDFTALSIFNLTTNDFFVSQDRDNQNGRSGEASSGNTNVPVAPPTVVPEPASMLLLGAGLVGVAVRLRRVRR